jgi:hypothetical protein
LHNDTFLDKTQLSAHNSINFLPFLEYLVHF